MNRTLAGLMGAAAALVISAPGHAADLLQPRVETVQYYPYYYPPPPPPPPYYGYRRYDERRYDERYYRPPHRHYEGGYDGGYYRRW